MVTSTHTYTHRGVTTRLTVVDSGIIRVTCTKRDTFLEHASATVVHDGKADAVLTDTPATIRLDAGQVTVEVDKASGSMTFLDTQGRVLLREPRRRPHVLEERPVMRCSYEEARVREGESIDGVRAWAEPVSTRQERTAYECRQNFIFDEDEALYGLGSHEEGYGNLRGRSQLLYQHNMKAVVPVLVSTKGWGILFDMGCLMAFHDDEQGSYLWADCADELDWYFFCGDGSYASLMGKYRLLTGAAPMLPLYALGYVQSKERYQDAAEMLAVADEYRRRGIPLDMLVLDWMSWPEGQWGWKTFDPVRFPDPSAFIGELHRRRVKFMISIWPSMQGDRNADRREMLDAGGMLGNRLIYNAFDPKARALYWRQAKEHLFDHGVDAWWCDCTEPFESDWSGSVRPEPLRRAQLNTDEAKRYLDPAQINLYSLYHAMGIYEGQRSVTDQRRVCNLTRSSYAGQHRYATVTWSGDISASWETLKRQVPEGLNFCATGEPYWSTDVGGFFPNGNWEQWFCAGEFDRGVDDLGYRELFVRWMQFAAFLPMMRAHGTVTPREIWRFGEAGEPFYDAIAKAIRLRYRLIPYMYALMAATHRTGLPMLRIPALTYPADAALRDCNDQLLLGDHLLVKPVVRPMYYLPESQPVHGADRLESVLLPAGHDWYGLSTGRRYAGGQRVTVEATLDNVPMFVRAGAVLPWGAEVQCTEELADAPLEIIVFPGEDGSFALYDDAGDGYGYEAGECAVTQLMWHDASRTLCVGRREGAYPGMPEERTLRVRCLGGEAQEICWRGEATTLQL